MKLKMSMMILVILLKQDIQNKSIFTKGIKIKNIENLVISNNVNYLSMDIYLIIL